MANLKLSKREIWMLHYLLDFECIRYMMCNAKDRADAYEKADVHIRISQNLAMFIHCEGTPRHEETENIIKCTMDIHDYLADILTDKMDVVIGFPIDKVMYGDEFEYYAEKFFDVILNHMKEIKQIALKGCRI
jgi:hypothetical protein